MQTKRYGIDLDGVNFKFPIGFRTYLKNTAGVDFNPDTVTHSYWHTPEMSISEEEFKYHFDEFGLTGGYRHLDVIENGPQVAQRLDELGHEIFYVTHRPLCAFLDTEYALEKHNYPQIDNLVFTEKNKSPHVNLLGINVFIDDAVYVVNDLCDNTTAKIYCMDYVYNRKLKPGRYTRIKDWEEFMRLENI